MKTWIEFDAGEWYRAKNRVKDVTDKQARSLVNRMAIYTARSARTAAKISEKKREVIEAKSERERALFGGFRWAIRVFGKPTRYASNRRSGGEMRDGFWYTNNSAVKDDLSVIRNRGLAKAMWAAIMQKLNVKGVDIPSTVYGLARRFTWVNFRRSRPYTIWFTNRSRYQAEIQPNILDGAMEKAKRAIDAIELKQAARKQEQAWRGAV